MKADADVVENLLVELLQEIDEREAQAYSLMIV